MIYFRENSIDFSDFRESEKSLKHELGSILESALLPVSLWYSGIISVSYRGANPGILLFDF